jgi:hypothetical protein
MSFFNWLKSRSEIRDAEVAPVEIIKSKQDKETSRNVAKQAPEPAGRPVVIEKSFETNVVEKAAVVLTSESALVAPPRQTITIPLSALLDQLPEELLVKNTPDPSRFVQIAKEDLVVEESSRTAAVPLSILSLSCPEIFLKPIATEQDRPVHFSLDAVAAPPPKEPTHLSIEVRSIIMNFPPELETPQIREAIASDAVIELPLALVKPQLESGRVTLSATVLRELLPPDLRARFAEIEEDIPIPLQEIFKDLPLAAIRRRSDQEIEAPESAIATPFTLQAREDAERFDPGSKIQPLPEVLPAVDAPPEPEAASPSTGKRPAPLNFERLQAVLMTDEPLDLKSVIEQLGNLPGLRGCVLAKQNGEVISASHWELERGAAILKRLPTLFREISEELSKLELRGLETITFYCQEEQLSTFSRGEFSLTVRHENRPFKPGVREKIQTVLTEIVRAQGS